MPNFRKQPTVWPNFPYYMNRFFQFLSCIGTTAVFAYFIYNLIKDRQGIPYEFILLDAVAVVSLINIISTTVAKCCGALSPKFAFVFDFVSLAGFAVAFGLLTKGMGPMVFKSCASGWGSEEGNGPWICRCYKAGWSFALGGIVFFASSVLLDLFVIRKNANHKYIPANPKSMQQTKTYNAAPNYTQDTSYGSGGLNQ